MLQYECKQITIYLLKPLVSSTRKERGNIMAGLTKTQINYLESKLNRAVEDKVDKFRKELGGNSSDKVLVNEIVAGNIKLLPKSELIKKLKEKANYSGGYYYNVSLYVNEMVSQEDKERVEKEVNERETKINEFREKLYKAKQNALDSIVLDGVDVETALAELDNI